MPEVIYILCSLLSAWCAVLLLRRRPTTGSATHLMFWTGVCFAGLALNNALLVADLVIFPRIDLSLWRTLVATLAMSALVLGLVWERY